MTPRSCPCSGCRKSSARTSTPTSCWSKLRQPKAPARARPPRQGRPPARRPLRRIPDFSPALDPLCRTAARVRPQCPQPRSGWTVRRRRCPFPWGPDRTACATVLASLQPAPNSGASPTMKRTGAGTIAWTGIQTTPAQSDCNWIPNSTNACRIFCPRTPKNTDARKG